MKRKKKRKPYLGPLFLAWCLKCNLPIAKGKQCGRCGAATSKVRVTPPGDARPAFEGDIKPLRSTISVQFGAKAARGLIPSDKIVLLNAIPELDRCEEVILDGQIIGLHRFRLEQLSWEFIPKLEGARRLAQLLPGRCVAVDDVAARALVRGANLMGPGVEAADASIKSGDAVFVVNQQGSVVLTGTAQMTGEEMQARNRGVAVRNRYSGPPADPKILPGGQTWEQVVEANDPLLQQLERKAIRFIRSTTTEITKHPVVAFSGGKDSLVVLLLVRKALRDHEFHVMFINTGIEFPETVENVSTTTSNLGLMKRLLVGQVNEDQFFRVLEQYGFVARDYRVCCKTVKLGPTAQLIEEHFPEGCLSFIGQRRYESQRRSQSRRVWRNPWVPKQIGASPIHDWTALMIWLYLMKENAPYNVLYQRGFERIGCMFCPASDMSEFTTLQSSHPEEWRRWRKVATRITKQQGLSEKWLKFGFWRWRNHPPPIRKLARQLGISLTPETGETTLEKLAYTITSISEEDGEKILQGRFNQPIPLDLAITFLPALGDVLYDVDRGIVQVLSGKGDVQFRYTLFESGDFTIKGMGAILEKEAEVLVKAVLRGILCTGCGICLSLCHKDAIVLEHQRARIEKQKCIQCRACLMGQCPTLFGFQRASEEQ
ncbi:MAG: phosphoadenosine phosphosulfate reductase family protein [Promethearchaeota archaeon]